IIGLPISSNSVEIEFLAYIIHASEFQKKRTGPQAPLCPNKQGSSHQRKDCDITRPQGGSNFNEGIRISKAPNGQNEVAFGVYPAQTSGRIDGYWVIGIIGTNVGAGVNQFAIIQSPETANVNRGLRISADGNTLIFNSRIF
ncbi:MAG: hypothetical protein EZS28_033986, partial [Streblomastix strix]